mgnify:CR=1 FL=1
MLLSNAFRPDPRVAREAQVLADAGHQVTIICWDREVKYPTHETVGGYRIERIQHVRTVYGAGARQILHTPRFWRAAAARVRELHPDVIHCHDLDTLPAGWWLKEQTGAKLVYDAHEDYPAMMSLYLPGPMVRMLSWLERYLLHRVDYIITASTMFADKLRGQGIAPVTTIGNYQSLEPFDALTETEILAARTNLGLQPDDLALVYIGGFSRNRQLLPLIEAARNLPDVRVFLWGDGHQRNQVVSSAAQVPNVKYLGWLSSEDVPLYTSAADVIYYCLLPNYPGAVYNAPNTLSNAMAAGCPIIANDVGDLGRIIRQNGCGLLLPEATPAHICQAVKKLKDPIVRQQMGIAGRRAAETFYNWTIAGDELEQVYAKLMDERELE